MRLTKTTGCINCQSAQLFTQIKNGRGVYYFSAICDKCNRARRREKATPNPTYQHPRKEKPEVCRSCGLSGRSYSSRLNGAGVRYYNLDCTTCRGQNRHKFIKRLRVTDPERYYRIRRHEQLRRVFRISLVEYEQMLAKQGNKCAICEKPQTTRTMSVDHDHATGKIRSLLCQACNQGLGNFKDSKTYLTSAAKYIEKHKNDTISTSP